MRDNEPFAGRTPIAPGEIAPMLRALEARTTDPEIRHLLRCAVAMIRARDEMIAKAVESYRLRWQVGLTGFVLGLLAALIVWDLARWPEIWAALNGGK